MIRHFDFRCLRENRRVVQDESRRAELDIFHTVLTDISHGVASNEVRDFMIGAYVRGYQIATAEHVPFEGSTAVPVSAKKRWGAHDERQCLLAPLSPYAQSRNVSPSGI